MNLPLILFGVFLILLGLELNLRQRVSARPDQWETRPLPKPDQKAKRILVLGDSIAYGYELTEAQAWPSRLAADLRRAYPGQKWQIINAGVPGETVADAYTRAIYLLRIYQPQLVLIALGLNDCRRAYSETVAQRLVRFRRNETTLWAKSYLLRTLVNLLIPIRVPKDGDEGDSALVPPEAFGAILTWLVRQARRFRSKPVLLTLTPLDERLPGRDLGDFRQWESYNAIIRETARTQDAPFIELSHQLAAKQPWQEDGVHLSAAGEAVVAERVWQGLHRPHLAPILQLRTQASNAEMAPSLD